MTTHTLLNPDPALNWRDRKRPLWMLGLVVPLFPFFAGALALASGWTLFWWLGPIVLYGLVPLLDTLIGTDRDNPPESAVPALEQDRYYRWCTYLFIPLQFAGLAWSAWLIAGGTLSPMAAVGLAITVGLVNGIAINTAHELGHKRETLERWLARLALAPSAYGHFFIEHNRGHHVRVATPEDPASSRLGESFWAFLPRSVIGSVRSAWQLEAQRLARSGLPAWHWRNENLQSWAMTLLLFGALALWLGAAILPFLLLQALFGFSMLEVVNYLEHYGLRRRKETSGRYERCRPEHSWNSNHVVTNLLLYQLQRHSDHHANPTRSYQSLRHFEQAPQLPSGYASMILLAYIPPLWRAVMDKRVLAHYGGDVTRANVHPPLRAQLLARHGAAAPRRSAST